MSESKLNHVDDNVIDDLYADGLHADGLQADDISPKRHKKKKKRKRESLEYENSLENESEKTQPISHGFYNTSGQSRDKLEPISVDQTNGSKKVTSMVCDLDQVKGSNRVAPMTFDLDAGVVDVDHEKFVVPKKVADINFTEFQEMCQSKTYEGIYKILRNLTREEAAELVNRKDRFRCIHYAARYAYLPGAFKTVQLLVQHGARVDGLDIDGQTALHHASSIDFMRGTDDQGGDLNIEPTVDNSMVHYLVSKGCDVNLQDYKGNTALAMAIMRKHDVVTRDIAYIKAINFEIGDFKTAKPLHFAAYFLNKYSMTLLLDRGAKLDAQDLNLRTPVHYLTWQENGAELLRIVLDREEQRNGKKSVTRLLSLEDNEKKTPLHLSCEAKCLSITRLLLEKGANPDDKGSHDESTALHIAAATGDLEILKILLEYGANDFAQNAHGNTALHMAAANNHTAIITYLVQRNNQIIKRRNAQNMSAVLLAALYGSSEALLTLLDLGANAYDRNANKTLLRLAVDNGKDATVEAVLEFCRKANLLNLLIRADNDNNTPLHIAAKLGHIRCVRVMCQKRFALPGLKSSWWNNLKQTPLHFAAMYGHVVIAKELIRVGYFDIDAQDEEGFTPIERAAEAGNNNVVQTLIKVHASIKSANDTHFDLLHVAAMNGWSDTCAIVIENGGDVNKKTQLGLTPLHIAAIHNHVECIDLFIKCDADVRILNDAKENCLDLGIRHASRDAVKAMILSQKWNEMLRNKRDDPDTGYRDTPLRKLIRVMPDIAEMAFERCINNNKVALEDEDYEVMYNYEFLDDIYTDYSASVVDSADNKLPPNAQPYTKDKAVFKNNHPLRLMVDHECEQLLRSPLVASCLEHKWNTYGFYVFYINLIAYVIFTIMLTVYVVDTKAPYSYFKASRDNCTADSCSNIVEHCVDHTVHQKSYLTVCQYIVLIFSIISLIKEILQAIAHKREYLQWENILEWLLFGSSILVVSNISSCVRSNPGIREPWQWQLASIAILLAWLELMLFIRRVPRFGIFVVMFTDILATFLQFLPVFFLLLIGFSLSFSMLFGNQNRFNGGQYSLVSTFIMMVGEMDFQDIFFGSEGDRGSTVYAETTLYYQGTSYALYIIFVGCMTILTMNLLVGLAVDDIQAVQEHAELKRLAMRAELALNIESLLPLRFRRRFIVRCHRDRPNVQKSRLGRISKKIKIFFEGETKPAALSQQDEMQQRILRRVDTLVQRVERLEGIEKMLVQLTRAQDKQQLKALNQNPS